MSLTTVVSWLMEHAMKHHFTELDLELSQLFPLLVPSQLEIPNMETLMKLSFARNLKAKKASDGFFKNLDNLNTQLSIFEKFPQDSTFKSQTSHQRSDYFDFLYQIKRIIVLVEYQNLICNVQHELEHRILDDFKVDPIDDYKPEIKKVKIQVENDLVKVTQTALGIKHIQLELKNGIEKIINHQFLEDLEDFLLKNVLKGMTLS
jgi:hypothetical protein